MPHYVNIQPFREGWLLLCDDGSNQICSAVAAEQILLSSINCWAGVNPAQAEEEMALLTRLMRQC